MDLIHLCIPKALSLALSRSSISVQVAELSLLRCPPAERMAELDMSMQAVPRLENRPDLGSEPCGRLLDISAEWPIPL